MANITLSVTNQRLTVSQLPIAAESVQYLTAEVTYTTDDWDNRTVSAMFGRGDTIYEIAVEDGKITADKQLNLTAGDWLVWLVGVSEKVGDITPRITTNTCHLSVAPTGGTEGNPFPVIPPTQAEKIQAEIDELAAKTDSFAGDIATAKETATSAEKTAQAAETAANSASSKADSASGKADTAQATADSATTAAANAQAAADEAASKATTAQSKADSAATAAANAQSTADAAKATATAVDTKAGNLSDLTTTDKSSLVAAINEAAKSGGGAANAVLYTEQTLTDAEKAQARTNIGAGTGDGIDVSGAVGQIIKIKAVDDTGKPTEWEAVDMPSGGSYTLPTASADTLGGVKVGDGLSIADGVLSASGSAGHFEKISTIKLVETGLPVYFAIPSDKSEIYLSADTMYAESSGSIAFNIGPQSDYYSRLDMLNFECQTHNYGRSALVYIRALGKINNSYNYVGQGWASSGTSGTTANVVRGVSRIKGWSAGFGRGYIGITGSLTMLGGTVEVWAK